MRISLIYPLLSYERSRIDENKQFWPPLGIAYIASVLINNGHAVQVIDRDIVFRKEQFNFEKTNDVSMEKIFSFNSEIVGFSATTPNISDVKLLSAMIKKHRPDILTVLGGPHATGEPALSLEESPDIDIVVRGEGEETMLEITGAKPLDSMPGITFRHNNGKIYSNPDRPLLEDIDSLPLPDRSLLDMEFYTRPNRFTGRNLNLRATHIFTARGCPYCCHYCAGPLMGRRKVRFHSGARVLSEIKELIDIYHIEAIYFAEDMFLSNKARAREVLGLFIKEGINKKIVWMAQLSTKVVDAELLSLMKKAGCVHIEYGFESGSQRILNLMNKGTSVEQNIAAAMLTRKMGMRFQGNFIAGYPHEQESDFKDTVKFIKKVKPTHISLNMFMPLPGTYIYNKLKNENKLLPGWDNIGNQDTPQLNYADMPMARFEELYLRARVLVILPMNLWHFLISNLSNPVRFFYIVFSQSLGLLIKIWRSVKRLVWLKRRQARA